MDGGGQLGESDQVRSSRVLVRRSSKFLTRGKHGLNVLSCKTSMCLVHNFNSGSVSGLFLIGLFHKSINSKTFA